MAEEQVEAKEPAQEELFEIEVVDDTPEEDQLYANSNGEAAEDDEMKGLGKRAQNRIGQLKREFHDQRREAEAAQRMQTEAISAAQSFRNENEQLKALLRSGNSALFDVTKAKNDADLVAAQTLLTKAYDEGNAEEIVVAQTQLNDLMFDGRKLQEAISERQNIVQTPATVASVQQQKKPDITLTERDADWIRKNPWFQKDQKLTAYAMGLHYELTQQKGIHPNGSEYYKKIDEEMRKHFAIDELNKNYQNGNNTNSVSSDVRESDEADSLSVEFESEETVAPVVAPATRSSNKKPMRAKLTKTQVSLAKKFGLTNEQYARHVLKLERENG